MALPDSAMSSVFAIDASLIANPIASALSEQPEFGCPPVPNLGVTGMTVESVCVRVLAGARFVPFRGGVAFDQPLRVSICTDVTIPILNIPVGALQLDCEVHVMLAVTATTTGTPWGLALGLTYPATPNPAGDQLEVTCETVEDPERTQIENAVRASLDTLLRNVPIPAPAPIALGTFLTSQTAAGPVGLVITDTSEVGSTLLVGVSFTGDADASLATFQGSFDPLSFAASTEWAFEIDQAAMLAEVRSIAGPGGAAIPGLPALLTGTLGLAGATVTTGTPAFFWTGGTIPIRVPLTGAAPVLVDPVDAAEITLLFNDHPVWFIADINVTSTWGLAVRSGYVIGHIDINLTDEGGLLIDPKVSRVRYLGVTLPLSATQLPTTSIPPFPEPTRMTDVSYDTARLRMLGLDDTPVYGGSPEIEVIPKMSISNRSGPCGSGISFSDELSETLFIQNQGGSPLWICDIEIDPPGDFSLSHAEEGNEPFAIPAGGWLPVEVTLEASGYAEHTAILRIRNSDCTQNPAEVELVGERATDAELQLMHETCLDGFPQEPEGFWEDFQDLLNRAHRELEPPGHEVDPPERDIMVVDALVRGLEEGALFVTDEHTRATLVQRHMAGGHLVSLPIGVASAPEFGISKTTWRTSPHLNLRIHHAEVRGAVETKQAILELATDGPLVLGRFEEDSAAAFVVDTSLAVRAAGTLKVDGRPDAVGVRGRIGWVLGQEQITVFDLGDPDAPVRSTEARIPRDAAVYATQDGYVAVRKDGVVQVFEIEGDGPRLSVAWRPSVEVTNFERVGSGGIFFGPRGAFAVSDLGARSLENAHLYSMEELPREYFRNLERSPQPSRWIDRGSMIFDALTPRTGFYVRVRTTGRTRWNHAAVEKHFGLGRPEGDPKDLPPVLG